MMNHLDRLAKALELARDHNMNVRIDLAATPEGVSEGTFHIVATGNTKVEDEVFNALRSTGYIPYNIKIALSREDHY